MKTLTLLLALLLFVPFAVAQPLPDCYHTIAEVYDMLFTMQEETDHPERIKIDTLGYSPIEEWPIYSVKISDDAYTDYDRPVVAVFGPLHAEEVSGMELVMQAMDTLLNNPTPEFRTIRQNLEVYFVPTQNPDGVDVVFGESDDCIHGADISFRKNRLDANNNGSFDYEVGWGNDIDGVDLNRNFDINFFHGDTLLHLHNENEPYDYYMGEYPFSEVETQIMRDFIREIRPLFSITYHDSRTGNFSRKIMFPWAWSTDDTLERRSPDFSVMNNIASLYEAKIEAFPGFEPAGSGGRNGKMHDWMYAEGGWDNMQTELQENQPSCESLQSYINEVMPSVWYLMHRAYASDVYIADGERGHVKFIVKDEQSNPLVAEVKLPEYHDGYLKPRMTDPVWGVHRRPLLPDLYQVVTRAWGYAPDTSQVSAHETLIAEHHVTLTELNHHGVNIHFQDVGGNDLSGTIVMKYEDWWIDTLEVDPGWSYMSWPEGHYEIEMWSEDYVPYRIEWDHTEDVIFNPNLIEIVEEGGEATQVWKDEFETGDIPARWSSEGDFPWVYTSLDHHGGDHSLKSDNETFIPLGEDGTLTLEIEVPENDETLTLMGWRAYELEADRDFCTIELSTDGENWSELEQLSGEYRWHPFFYDLREYNDAETIWIRWAITTSPYHNDRGLFLDDISLQASADWYNDAAEDVVIPGTWALHPAFPNPFNPTTRISYEVASKAFVNINVYDILGREVMNLVKRDVIAGKHIVNVDMSDFATGIYFVRMQTSHFESIQKVLLVK